MSALLSAQLVAQMIPEFFDKISVAATVDSALMRQVDLCEDEAHRVRVVAMQGLPKLCGTDVDSVSRIANMLGQMLMNDSEEESNIVKHGLFTLTNKNVQGTLTALFEYVSSTLCCAVLFLCTGCLLAVYPRNPVTRRDVARVLCCDSHIVSEDEGLRAKVVDYLLDTRVTGPLVGLLQKDDEVQAFFVEQVTKACGVLPSDQTKKMLGVASRLKVRGLLLLGCCCGRARARARVCGLDVRTECLRPHPTVYAHQGRPGEADWHREQARGHDD